MSPGTLLTAVLAIALARTAIAEQPAIKSQQEIPRATPVAPGNQLEIPPAPSEQSLTLPQQWTPTQADPLPPVPQPLAEVDVPDALIGCWRGKAAGFDRVYPMALPEAIRIGEPSEITFCYHPHSIDVPNAEVYVPPAKRAVEVALTLGLGYTSFKAHGIKTDIYSISPTQMRGRTTLDVDRTFHFLYFIPFEVSPQPSVVDWKGTMTDPETVHLEAYQVLWLSGQAAFGGTWHADFKRLESE